MSCPKCDCEDCAVLAAALRRWTRRRWPADRAGIKAEIGQLIDVVETIGPRDASFYSRVDAARSFVVLERPEDALNRIDSLLSMVH